MKPFLLPSARCASALFVLLLATCTPSAAQDPSPWGLRNIELVGRWEEGQLGSTFGEHNAGYVAFWSFWGDLEPTPPPTNGSSTYVPDCLNDSLDMVHELGAVPVIVFHLDKTLPAFAQNRKCLPDVASSDPFWAMTRAGVNEARYTGPIDLCAGDPESCQTLLTHPDPDPRPTVPYSQLLYDVSTELAQIIAAHEISGDVYLRFHNESWGDWGLGADADWEENLHRYLLSYLTFRDAVLDVQEVTTGVTFHVSHGSLPRTRITPKALYLQGVGAGMDVKNAIVARMDSLIERMRCDIANRFMGLEDGEINDWADAAVFGGPTYAGEYKARQDTWLAKFVEWTVSGIFDFTTFHPHGKPVVTYYDRLFFDQRVSALGGDPPAWLAAETAFEIKDQPNWGHMALKVPGQDLDEFIAQDLARKWCTLLAHGDTIAFCSPIRGPADTAFRGLYRGKDCRTCQVGCSVPSPTMPCEDTGAPCQDVPDVGCTSFMEQNICPDPANAAFELLADVIGDPVDVETMGTPDDTYSHYRYQTTSGFVDVVWRNRLWDSEIQVSHFTIDPPDTYTCATIYDVVDGVLSRIWFGNGDLTVTNINQEPRVVAWCKLQQR